MMFTKFKLITFLFFAFSFAVLLTLLHIEKRSHSITKQKLQLVEEELQDTKAKLASITESYSELKNLCELDKHKIENRYKTLLQKAMQKPKTVEVPVVIEKPVYIPNEDCERLGVMIDEALNLVNSE